jgi:hypothetical protein
MDNEDNMIDAEVVDNLPAVIQPEASNAERIQSAAWTAKLEDNESRRCAAHKKNGEQCRKFAIQGSTVCRTHGGATRHVKNKARIRVENASNRLMGKLIQFAFDDTKPPATQLDAIKDSLNRAGLRPPAEVVLSQGDKPYEEVFEGISSGSRAESRRARGLAGVEANENAGNAPPTQSNGPYPNPPPNTTSPAESVVTRGIPMDYADLEPEYVARAANAPLYQERADPSFENGEAFFADAPSPAPRGSGFDRDRDAQRPPHHIQGDDALRVAGDLARQKAIESPPSGTADRRGEKAQVRMFSRFVPGVVAGQL